MADRLRSRGSVSVDARGGMRPVLPSASGSPAVPSAGAAAARLRGERRPRAGRAAGTALLGPAKGKARERQPQPKLLRKALLSLVSSSRHFVKTIR